MGYLLYLISQILYIPLTVLNVPTVLWKYRKTSSFSTTISQYFFEEALHTDIFANRSFRALWNATMKTEAGYGFGKEGETISSALGKNQLGGTLSKTGWVLVYILWALDSKYWGKGGHCINSIQNVDIQR